jgi:serine protease Do
LQGIGELRSIEDRVKQVAAKVTPAVVAVKVGQAQGSGIVVSKDGIVLTAGHLTIKPKETADLIFPDGKTVHGVTLGINRDADAGMVRITDKDQWPCVEMAPAGSVRPGMWCVALGHPLGYQTERPPVIRLGRVLHVSANTLHTDCTLVAGDSGGPVFDLDGRLIGINSRIAMNVTSLNFHVPVDIYHRFWDKMLRGEVVQEAAAGKDSAEVKNLFRPVVTEAGRCVVRIRCDGQDAALGAVVGPDGWVLTKASQLHGKIVCRTRDGQEREARWIGVSPAFDLAMLKIEAAGFPNIPWCENSPPVVGQWVATPGMGDSPLALGVVSLPLRHIRPISGQLGVHLLDGAGGPTIDQIEPDSPAKKAGLQPKDLVLQVNAKPVHSRQELVEAIRQFKPGAAVKLLVKRADKNLEIAATLGTIQTPSTRKRDMQNLGAPGVSRRHDDFPKVLQHDTVLAPADCGGPLVDLNGRVLGINIARAGRTETYAVPTEVLLGLMYDLMSGRLPPPHEAAKPEPPKQPAPDKKPESPKPQALKPEPAKPQPAKPESSKQPAAQKKPEPPKK